VRRSILPAERRGARGEGPQPLARRRAIEAAWDGDTIRDWFVVLSALGSTSPSLGDTREVWLSSFTGEGAELRATDVGQTLARAAGVTFRFTAAVR
jgi:hypothetical protein